MNIRQVTSILLPSWVTGRAKNKRAAEIASLPRDDLLTGCNMQASYDARQRRDHPRLSRGLPDPRELDFRRPKTRCRLGQDRFAPANPGLLGGHLRDGVSVLFV